MKCAVFTMVRNEAYFLPLFLRHYSQWFKPHDIYILDHESMDGSTTGLNVNVVRVHNELYSPHQWMQDQVKTMQRDLLGAGYDYVLFAECDELIIADPIKYIDLGDFLDRAKDPVYRCTGYDLVQMPNELELDPHHPGILEQRRSWAPVHLWNKPLLSSVPLEWEWGYHTSPGPGNVNPDPNLLLVHLHHVDYKYFLDRHEWKARQKWKDDGNASFHNRWNSDECKAHYEKLRAQAQAIPEYFIGCL